MDNFTPHQVKYFAYALSSGTGAGSLAYALMNADVDLVPHQIEAALFALQSPISKGAILADEGGIGKTIEAGLVLCQLWAEGRRRLLVICPTSLRDQWADELADKFHLPVIIADGGNFAILPDAPHVLIMSYNFASSVHKEIAAVDWDYIVIDAAHRLFSLYQDDSKIAKNIFEAVRSRQKAALAKPMCNSLMDIYSLISLVDDNVFSSPDSFKEQYIHARKPDALKERIRPYIKRTLRKDAQKYVKLTNRHAMVYDYKLSDRETELYGGVMEYITSDHIWAVSAYRKPLMTLMLQKYLGSSSVAVAGTLKTFKKNLYDLFNGAEYTYPLADEYYDSLEEEISAYDGYFQNKEAVAPVKKPTRNKPSKSEYTSEIATLDRLITLAESITEDSKAPLLLKALDHAQNAVVYTESVRTQMYLKSYLEKNGHQVAIFNANTKEIDKFREMYLKPMSADKKDYCFSVPVLISTESGAEGRNLQFCSTVINYDLPWNPQRIEDRIVSCHRYGQAKDVAVVNFLNMDNIAEQHAYHILEHKFKLFEGMFGASDEILGSVEGGTDFELKLYHIMRSCRRPEDIDKAFTELQESMAIEEKMREAKRQLIENFNSDVTALVKIEERSKSQKARNLDFLWHMTKYILSKPKPGALSNRYYFNDKLRILGTLEDEVTTGVKPEYAAGSFAYNIGEAADTPPRPPRQMSKNERKAWNNRRMIYYPGSPLGQSVIGEAKKLETPTVEILFRHSGLEPESMQATSGYILLSALTFHQGKNTWTVPEAAICDSAGNLLPENTVDTLFLSDGKLIGQTTIPADIENILLNEQSKQFQRLINEREALNKRAMHNEERKFSDLASDKRIDYELALKKTMRLIDNLTEKIEKEKGNLKARLALIDRRNKATARLNRMRLDFFKMEEVEEKNRQKSMRKLAKMLHTSHNGETVFMIKWKAE